MRKFNLFGFLDNKLGTSESIVISQKLIDQIAMKELAIHIAVSYIANTLSKCEFRTFEANKEVFGKLYYKLNVSPNPNQNSSQFWNQVVERYFYDGHALVVKHGDHLYCADTFMVDERNPLKETVFHNVCINGVQMKGAFKARDVFYFKLDDKNVKLLVDGLYMQYGEVLSYAVAAYKRTNGAKYKLIMKRYAEGDPNFKKVRDEQLRKNLKAVLEQDNAVYVESKDDELQLLPSGTPTSTADIVAMRKEMFEIAAQSFKVPLSMMNGNITNMNEIVKVYLSICIDPLADMFGEEITRKYYDYDEWHRGCGVMVDTSCINHVDILDAADGMSKAIGSGAVTIDDMRRRMNLRPLNTEFSSTLFMTKNYAPASEMLNAKTP